jgi:hypothetical protein
VPLKSPLYCFQGMDLSLLSSTRRECFLIVGFNQIADRFSKSLSQPPKHSVTEVMGIWNENHCYVWEMLQLLYFAFLPRVIDKNLKT